MGQTFKFASPSVNEVLTWGGRLGEILFDGSAQSLVDLLAVPVRPGTHSRSPRLPEGEQEAAPLLADTQSTERKTADRLDERPTDHAGKKRKRESTVISNPGQTKANCPSFSSLAGELHDLIFEELEIKDILSLSLTNGYFWGVGQRHIHTYFMSFMGLWAGERIICVGEDVDVGDYPPGLFTEDEKRELLQLLDEDGRPTTLSRYIDEFEEIDQRVPTLNDCLMRSKGFFERCRMFPNQCEIMDAVQPMLSPFYAEEVPWILRNLTTREYVRSEAIALKPEHIHGPKIDFLGFGEVLLSRICWSSNSFISMRYNGNIHRGIWAGHRFDITTRARHDQDAKEEWKDVSEEVVKEIASIWESECGSDWRRIGTKVRWGRVHWSEWR